MTQTEKADRADVLSEQILALVNAELEALGEAAREDGSASEVLLASQLMVLQALLDTLPPGAPFPYVVLHSAVQLMLTYLAQPALRVRQASEAVN